MGKEGSLTTRETVDECTPASLASSFRVVGTRVLYSRDRLDGLGKRLYPELPKLGF
jgi:hypothetical protein